MDEDKMLSIETTAFDDVEDAYHSDLKYTPDQRLAYAVIYRAVADAVKYVEGDKYVPDYCYMKSLYHWFFPIYTLPYSLDYWADAATNTPESKECLIKDTQNKIRKLNLKDEIDQHKFKEMRIKALRKLKSLRKY